MHDRLVISNESEVAGKTKGHQVSRQSALQGRCQLHIRCACKPGRRSKHGLCCLLNDQ